jgi:hypothetical protein
MLLGVSVFEIANVLVRELVIDSNSRSQHA